MANLLTGLTEDQKEKVRQIKFAVLMTMSRELFIDPDCTIDILSDIISDEIIICLSMDILGSTSTAIVRYPCGWWQAFKEQYFPKFVLDMWPVIYEIKTIDARVLFPYAKSPGSWGPAHYSFDEHTRAEKGDNE